MLNTSGIIYGLFKGIVYLPFFLTTTPRCGLGTELLDLLEKQFMADKTARIEAMLVYSTPDLVKFYMERGFALLKEPRLIGLYGEGKTLVDRIKKSQLLSLFKANTVTILYKPCSDLESFSRMLNHRKFDPLSGFYTPEDLSAIDALKGQINAFDNRYTSTRPKNRFRLFSFSTLFPKP